ncbi:hypothetical protein [Elongatibacter sediminis]|uniref:DUF2946 domain-containing protein n=1 Tax=Elongatibacter sediminis TaxID=3119006 RepID=A0AAW9RGK9_9GAMM
MKNRFFFARRLALVALALKLAVPAGFMPGSLASGQWLVVCPSGLPTGMLASFSGHGGESVGSGPHAGHHGATDGRGEPSQAPDHADHFERSGDCPTGASAAQAALVAALPGFSLRQARLTATTGACIPLYTRPSRNLHCRAPPTLLFT